MLNADSIKRVKRTLAGLSALLLLNAFPFMPSALAAGNGTLIVCTQPGGDVAAARQSLTDAGCTVLSEIPFATGNFCIMHVRPNNGDVTAAVAKFNGSIDPNIVSAEATMASKTQWFCWPPRPSCVPNDPDFPSQYALPAMDWNDARCTLRLLGINQRAYPRFTTIDSGVNSISANDEMVNVTQYNFVGGLNGVPECNFDSGVHGTAVTGIAGARTNNSTFISGVSSHNLPVKIVSCRVSADGDTIATVDVLRAMVWCVDHQRERGGPGVINVSLNSFGLPKYNGSPVVQEIAKNARKQGDIIVNASGNEALVDPSPEKYMRRVLALDENNLVASFSNTGPFKGAAPGVL
ncbi:MAG: S8 family serine peptidase, partial [Candidatus Obscuribacterales bacterium]|nr:S8 family serine peptidase [Candidatus Obscuribacterales bacterium]